MKIFYALHNIIIILALVVFIATPILQIVLIFFPVINSSIPDCMPVVVFVLCFYLSLVCCRHLSLADKKTQKFVKKVLAEFEADQIVFKRMATRQPFCMVKNVDCPLSIYGDSFKD